MKTQEELNTIKNEVETVSKKLADLTEEELEQVTGGFGIRHPSVSDENSENIDWEQLIEG